MLTKAYPGTWVVEAMERGGVDVQRLARLLPREFDELLKSTHTASPDDVLALLDACAEIARDANFGLHMGTYLELTRIGTYGYLLLNAPTIREFLDLCRRLVEHEVWDIRGERQEGIPDEAYPHVTVSAEGYESFTVGMWDGEAAVHPHYGPIVREMDSLAYDIKVGTSE